MHVGAVSQSLALDQAGRATAWVQTFRPDRPGSGCVEVWGLGATADRLPMIRAVTEYGLVREVARP